MDKEQNISGSQNLCDLRLTVAVFPHSQVSLAGHVGKGNTYGLVCAVKQIHADQTIARDGSPFLDDRVTPTSRDGVEMREVAYS